MRALLLVTSLACACGEISGDAPPPPWPGSGKDTGVEEPSDPPDWAMGCAVDHILEVIPLDIWGQDLRGASIVHDGKTIGTDVPSALGSIWLGATDSDTVFNLDLSAQDHFETNTQLIFDQDADGGSWRWSKPTGTARMVANTRVQVVDGEDCPFTTVFIGLDHTWFAASSTPPSLNEVEFFIGGAPFFDAMQHSLENARKRISWATWWWESDFELTRPEGHLTMTTYERRRNTAMGLLNAIDGTVRRILVNRFYEGDLDWDTILNSDSHLWDRAEVSGDDFEVMLQGNLTDVPTSGEYTGSIPDFSFAERVMANPRYTRLDLTDGGVFLASLWEVQAASWHQKFLVIDGKEAFVGGQNVKSVDWDTAEHLVFDHRRMDFDASTAERLEVYNGQAYPTGVPRRDYGVHFTGPAARDLEAVFQARWNLGMADEVLYADNATPFTLDAPSEGAHDTLIQVVKTSPAPLANQSILESHEKAMAQARDHMIIEDQYFRAPDVEDDLRASMIAHPALRLTVVTNPVPEWDPGLKYTHLADATFRDRTPERYQLFTLKTTALTFEAGWFSDEVVFHHQAINVHSKLRIVDQRFVMVGSANWNNRGMKYEGETNIHILDTPLTTAIRSAVLTNWVGPRFSALLSDDAENNFDVLEMAADWNAEVAEYWTEWAPYMDIDEAEETWETYGPSGLLYPLEISADWTFDVGPDLF